MTEETNSVPAQEPAPVSSTPEVVPEKKKRRAYNNRQHEFDDTDIQMMLSKLTEAKAQIKLAELEVKNNPTEANINALKDLVNCRVRIYNRLRKLGYSSEAARLAKAAEKKGKNSEQAPVSTPTPESTENVQNNPQQQA